MAYCTQADIIKLVQEATLAQMTDDTAGVTVDAAKVTEAIAKADALIDGYLTGRYTVPLTTVLVIIRSASIDIAVYELYSRRGERGVPENVTDRYKNAIKTLTEIQRGNILLGVAAPDSQTSNPIQTDKTDEDRIFSEDALEGF